MVKAKLASTALLIVMAHNKRPHGTKCNLSKVQIRHSIGGKILLGMCWWEMFCGNFLVENLLVETFWWKILCPLACF